MQPNDPQGNEVPSTPEATPPEIPTPIEVPANEEPIEQPIVPEVSASPDTAMATPTQPNEENAAPSISESPVEPVAPSTESVPTPANEPAAQPSSAFFGSVNDASPTPAAPAAPVAATAATVSSTPTTKKSNKVLIIVLIIVFVVLLGGGASAYYVLSQPAAPVATNQNASMSEEEAVDEPEQKDILARTDGTLDLSGSVDGTKAITAQSLTAGLNEQVNLSNGLSLMVTKVERNFTAFDAKYLKVEADEEVVALTVVVGSRNEKGNGFVKSAFTVKSPSEEKIVTEFVSSLANVEGMLDAGSGPEKGEQFSGKLLYVVKKDETPLSAHYEANYKNISSGETVTLAATINLQ